MLPLERMLRRSTVSSARRPDLWPALVQVVLDHFRIGQPSVGHDHPHGRLVGRKQLDVAATLNIYNGISFLRLGMVVLWYSAIEVWWHGGLAV